MRLVALLLVVFAAPFSLHAITIETVPVGSLGNVADVQGIRTIGAVDYAFDIGKFEVTNAQYVAMLNGVDPTGANPRGLYNSEMTTDARGGINFAAAGPNGSKYSTKFARESNPVVFVSFYDALRFTNWLHNGQGAANTEDGSYQLSGGTPIPGNGELVTRKASANWVLPTEDEWYKAAYHKNDGATNHYFDYPASSDAAPASDQPPGSGAPSPANTANFKQNDGLANGYNDGYAVTGSPTQVTTTNYLTNVGAYTLAHSPYGTFDQGGNAWEWNETTAFTARVIAGGSWINDSTLLAAAAQNNTDPANELSTIGFRVAKVIPGALPGDYNGNGAVDAADYTIWRDTLGSTTDLRANGDDTGASADVIDDSDYNSWESSFGQLAGSGAIAARSVPEPGTLVLALLAIGLPTRRTARHS